ncbi:DUF4231 domain-containing protein [Aggregatilineales bacterium SYSU G02658]
MALPPPFEPSATSNGKTTPAPRAATVLTPGDTPQRLQTTSTPSEYDAFKDPALLSAWRRFLDYDRVSTSQKRSYLRIREWVILLYFLAASGAVITTLLQASGEMNELVVNGLRLLLVIIPLISVGLNSYANQFASSIAWIEYRVGAETIREKIYLYRLRAGEFAPLLSLQDRQRKLLEMVNEADRRIDRANATLPYMQSLESEKLPGKSVPERVRRKTDTPFTIPGERFDDGFSPLSVADYLYLRIRNQIDWYTSRIEGDYNAVKLARLFALIIAGTGSVIAALGNGLEGLVAITTAAGVALTMKSDSRMYGATYATYHLTASRLRNELSQWEILTPEQQQDEEIGAELVARMEKILSEERETWRSSAIELQNNADRTVTAHIRTDGNPIAAVSQRANSLDEYPMLVGRVTEPTPSTAAPASPALLHADEPTEEATRAS